MRNSFLVVVQFLLVSIMVAQESTPYSRYGLGYLSDNNNIAASQMGGLGASFRSHESPNYINPASLSAVKLISFDVAFTGNFDKLKTQTVKEQTNSFTINYLSLSLPIKKFWTSSLAMLPYTNRNYFVSQNTLLDSIYGLQEEIEGSGSTYQVQWSNGFYVKGLSLGLTTGYLFGKINNNNFVYPTIDNITDYSGKITWTSSMARIRSFYWLAGVQYSQKIKSKKDSTQQITIDYGISGNTPFKIKNNQGYNENIYSLNSSYLAARGLDQDLNDFIQDYLNELATEDILDTFSVRTEDINMKIPAVLNIGVSAWKDYKWRAGIDFRYQAWSKYKGFENNSSSALTNSWRIGFGGEVIPNVKKYNKFFSKLKYRAGFYYSKTNLSIAGNNINEFGIDFGVGIPMFNKFANEEGFLQSYLNYPFNIGIQVGKRGTTQNNLIQENFVKLKLGFSLNDKWFVKRKYY